jgi:hypothetical protein
MYFHGASRGESHETWVRRQNGKVRFFHDGTERPINRPQDPEEQELYYSGKQKRHTLKNDVVIDEPCKIRLGVGLILTKHSNLAATLLYFWYLQPNNA